MFEPSLLDKLFDENPQLPALAGFKRISLDELKDMVARDLESLLNTRMFFSEEQLKDYPEAKHSMLSFGLNDFASLSLASITDRASICRSIENAIARQEPRLKNVRVSLELNERAINALHFGISALLVVDAANELVSFDAELQPSSLQYSVNKARFNRNN
jgi:type VI secretion system protein ImpF